MPGTLTIAAGSTSGTINIPGVVDDALDEVNETVTVTLSNAGNATLGDNDTHIYTIEDNDAAPSLSINDVTTSNESAANATFTATLSAASGNTVTVDYASSNGTATAGSDYTDSSGTLTFNPGQTSQTFTVPVLADSANEANETATLTLSNASNASISDATGTLTITDDDSEGSIIVRQPQHSGYTYDLIDLDNITVTIDSNSVTENPTSIDLRGTNYAEARTGTISLGDIPTSGALTMTFAYSAYESSGTGRVDANEGPRFSFDLTAGGVNYSAVEITSKQNDSDYLGSLNSVSRTFSFEYSISDSALSLTNIVDPIIFDLGMPGVQISTELGVNFDLDVDGFAELLTWPGQEDALLVLDHNGSGSIDDGTEVVSPRFQNGFYLSSYDALSSLDTNNDNVINHYDVQFHDLRLWVDGNQDGISQSGELRSLADEDIVSFNLDATSTGNQVDGSVITAQGSVNLAEGQTGTYVAVSFRELGSRDGVEAVETIPMNSAASAEDAMSTNSTEIFDFGSSELSPNGESLNMASNLIETPSQVDSEAPDTNFHLGFYEAGSQENSSSEANFDGQPNMLAIIEDVGSNVDLNITDII
jgi:hypothetical protein